MSQDLSKMATVNFDPLLQTIRTNLGKWEKLNFSLWGKVNIIKMVIAPQFNYISMMLPLNIPDHIFKQYENLIRDFTLGREEAQI